MIQKILKIYYENNDIILFSIIAIEVLIFFRMDKDINTDEWQGKYKNRIIKNIEYTSMILIVGKILSFIKNPIKFTKEYYYLYFFLLMIFVALLFSTVYLLEHYKVRYIILKFINNVKYIMWIEIFILTINFRLDMIEGIVGFISIIILEEIAIKLEYKGENQKNENSDRGLDLPTCNLYYCRQRQLERFLEILESQKYEPYAIMINCDWGEGKQVL